MKISNFTFGIFSQRLVDSTASFKSKLNAGRRGQASNKNRKQIFSVVFFFFFFVFVFTFHLDDADLYEENENNKRIFVRLVLFCKFG